MEYDFLDDWMETNVEHDAEECLPKKREHESNFWHHVTYDVITFIISTLMTSFGTYKILHKPKEEENSASFDTYKILPKPDEEEYSAIFDMIDLILVSELLM